MWRLLPWTVKRVNEVLTCNAVEASLDLPRCAHASSFVDGLGCVSRCFRHENASFLRAQMECSVWALDFWVQLTK